jgi:lipopolysaccharide/colanic/teichoic acid biosynthesis glycosyltransferase
MNRIKRQFDLFFSFMGVSLFLPLGALIALMIKIEDGGPIFFIQERVGYRGKLFRMIKFRTMVREADKVGTAITIGNDPRITRIGRWLRRFKLDEFPQLFNVLKGEMSFVGPRPEVPRYVAAYNDREREVLDLIPGITDPASIIYRNESEILGKCDDPEKQYIEKIMPDKIRINLEYARRANIMSDIFVILQTLGLLFKEN